jgi:DNA-binding transcriptional regulator YiaG
METLLKEFLEACSVLEDAQRRIGKLRTSLAEAMRSRRQTRKISVRAAAKAMNVTPSTILHWENGERFSGQQAAHYIQWLGRPQ